MRNLDEWQQARARLDSCPWPGPRPLTESDAAMFIGRDQDVKDFNAHVERNRLVVLTGESGVGKSSLLNAMLVPSLINSERVPIKCEYWSNSERKNLSADDYMKAVLQRPIFEISGVDICNSGVESVGKFLEVQYRRMGVLILDQFEEFIRFQPYMVRKISDWLVQTTRQYHTKIILSLRAEYSHRLRYIERRTHLHYYSMYLSPVATKSVVEDVIRSAEGPDGLLPIETKAVDALMNFWPENLDDDNEDDWISARVGLLHVQATMYALYFRAQGKTITLAHVDEFVQESSKAAESRQPSKSIKSIFDFGLREAVRRKLGICVDACKELELDRTFIEGVRASAYRMFPHLSSGGFKIDREAWELAELALDRALEQLLDSAAGDAPTSKDAEAIFAALWGLASGEPDEGTADLLTASRADVVKLMGLPDSKIDRPCSDQPGMDYDVSRWERDPLDVSAGPMLGFSAREVLIEELRRVVFAQHWLEESKLVRSSSRDVGKMLSLVHDRIGDALEDWARSDEGTVSGDTIHLLTAAKGRTFNWLKGRNPLYPLEERSGTWRTFVNLRWRDCQVSAEFRNMTFVNCDFSGTRFSKSVFEGVTFVNCVMDNATFNGCKIFGKVRPIVREKLEHIHNNIDNRPFQNDEPPSIYQKHYKDFEAVQEIQEGRPSFAVEVDSDTLKELILYRSDRKGGPNPAADWVFSKTSGVSAMPWRDEYKAACYFPREEGGLAMYGGRLSSLMIKGCEFENDGQLALRFIAGSTLDIVETGGCDIDIVNSSIRGLTVTRPVDLNNYRDAGEVKLSVLGSFFTNCWFGDRLSGCASFSDCQVFQMLNLSESEVFRIEIDNSLRAGVVSEHQFRDPKVSPHFDSFDAPDWLSLSKRSLADKMRQIDYRSDPAKHVLSDDVQK